MTWIPVRTRSYIRQESQFKYNHPDVSQLGTNVRSTDMEIAYSTSTFRTPDRPSIIRLDDVDFRLDHPLYRKASVPACICPSVSAARPDDVQ